MGNARTAVAPALPPFALPPRVAAELQDQLLSAATDLERLNGLLDHAAQQLMASFQAVNGLLGDAAHGAAPAPLPARLAAVKAEVVEAITALQFQDMAAQLIGHSTQRIRAVADYLACDGDDAAAPVELVQRNCPVAQREMEAGSIELF
ncbi:MAG: hypothetical protein AB7L76_07400 [Burkholderiaceae bacterium]